MNLFQVWESGTDERTSILEDKKVWAGLRTGEVEPTFGGTDIILEGNLL